MFFVNACQGFEKNQDRAEDMAGNQPVNHLLIFTAQAPGFPAIRNELRGSRMFHCLTYMLMNYASEKNLFEILQLVSQALGQTEKFDGTGQIPGINIFGLTNLYFNLPTSNN